MCMKTVDIIEGVVCGYETTKEFADRCGVKEVTVRQWIRRGKIQSLKIGHENYIEFGTAKPSDKRIK